MPKTTPEKPHLFHPGARRRSGFRGTTAISRKFSPSIAKSPRERPPSTRQIRTARMRAPEKAHLWAPKTPFLPDFGHRLPKNFTFDPHFFPILLTPRVSAPRFRRKMARIAAPESAHRCIFRNIEAEPGCARSARPWPPVSPHPCREVKNLPAPEPAHVLSCSGSPALPKPATHLSRRRSPWVP